MNKVVYAGLAAIALSACQSNTKKDLPNNSIVPTYTFASPTNTTAPYPTNTTIPNQVTTLEYIAKTNQGSKLTMPFRSEIDFKELSSVNTSFNPSLIFYLPNLSELISPIDGVINYTNLSPSATIGPNGVLAEIKTNLGVELQIRFILNGETLELEKRLDKTNIKRGDIFGYTSINTSQNIQGANLVFTAFVNNNIVNLIKPQYWVNEKPNQFLDQ